MIILYTTHGCASCRKARKYLKDNDLKFIEKDLLKSSLSEKEIRYLLQRCENGTGDIISTRSKIIREEKIDIDSMSFDTLVRFILEHPSILKRPILLDGTRMQIGYDADEISLFTRNQSSALTTSKAKSCH